MWSSRPALETGPASARRGTIRAAIAGTSGEVSAAKVVRNAGSPLVTGWSPSPAVAPFDCSRLAGNTVGRSRTWLRALRLCKRSSGPSRTLKK